MRIERLRDANPAATELALACALAARVEPALLRRLRLLIPGADASAEADLWFSDLLAGRDVLAMTLDPVVAEALRDELRLPARAELREAAHREISAAHADAHWSVRLEERVHYLSVARPPDAEHQIDDLLMAALDQLRTEPYPRNIARWLIGSIGRLPRHLSQRQTARTSTAVALLHLDRQAPPPDLLGPGESQAWLPWLLSSFPTVQVPVQLLDGAVVLGAHGPDSVEIPGVPDTDPLVVEVQWTVGGRRESRQVRFRLDEPAQVETGTRRATLVTLSGATYELARPDEPEPAGLNFDHIKTGLRPCLGRATELRELEARLRQDDWTAIQGRPLSGTSTLLVAAADAARASGMAVIEHFYVQDGSFSEASGSLLAQLAACYPAEFGDIPPSAGLSTAMGQLARTGAFRRQRLLLITDGIHERSQHPAILLDPDLPAGVHCLLTSDPGFSAAFEPPPTLELDPASDADVCRLMLSNVRFETRWPADALIDLADGLPGRLAPILRWVARQPAGTVTIDTIPPVLTTRWRAVRMDLIRKFGSTQTDMLLDVLRAAHGQHTWLDCAELNLPGMPDFDDVTPWRAFWETCLEQNIVRDTEPEDIVELTAPEAIDILRRRSRYGDRYLGWREAPVDEFVQSASRTRLSAAVGHALALGEYGKARALCTASSALRRRFAEDISGLLRDLEDVTRIYGTMVALRTVVHALATEGVSPTVFVTALSDRLVEHGTQFVVDSSAQAPLRVNRVINEWYLQSPDTAQNGINGAFALAMGERRRIIIRESDAVATDGTPVLSWWQDAVGAARGRNGGFVVWSERAVWTDTLTQPFIFNGVIDHVTRLSDQVAIAGTDGSVTVFPLPYTGNRYSVAGHGARVTATAEVGFPLVGTEDGTVRGLGGSPQTYKGHRSAVRAIAAIGSAAFVSGDADGALLQWISHLPTPTARWQEPSPITCLDSIRGGTVVFGTGDGRVGMWTMGAVTYFGDHDGPVRGLTAGESIVVSWADSLKIWNLGDQPELMAEATGFPGGVRDVLSADREFTVLCGDGSVQTFRLPSTRSEQARRCLAISGDVVFAAVGRRLIRRNPDGSVRALKYRGPFHEAVNVGAGVAVRSDSTLVILSPSDSEGEMSQHADHIAGDRSGQIIFASDRTITSRPIEITETGVSVHVSTPETIAITPSRITSLAVSPWTYIAGLASGDTQLRNAVLPGDGSPVIAVVGLPNDSVVTASQSGLIRQWQPGPTEVMCTSSPVVAMAVDGPWLLIATEDGRITVCTTGVVEPVYEVNLGTKIVALAADGGRAAARDVHGKLWELALTFPTSLLAAPNLVVRASWSGDTGIVELIDRSDSDYEVTAIRVTLDDKPMSLKVPGHWPILEPDGTLSVPMRPPPSKMLQLLRSGGPAGLMRVTTDIVSSEVIGYRATRTFDIALDRRP